MLKVSNLSLVKMRKPILKGLSLEIPRGRATLLLGKSGSGKTSLLRCIAALETEYQGDISYQGQYLSCLTPKERCRVIGFISQSFSLFPHMNILDNCARALRVLFRTPKKSAYRRAKEILNLLDIDRFGLCFPGQLSGGQQQRAAIARALVLQPSFLLFDEPTSALDPENTERFVGVMRTLLSAGTGMLISSQDMHLASTLLDRAYFVEEGRIVESYDAQEGKPVQNESRICHFVSPYSRPSTFSNSNFLPAR